MDAACVAQWLDTHIVEINVANWNDFRYARKCSTRQVVPPNDWRASQNERFDRRTGRNWGYQEVLEDFEVLNDAEILADCGWLTARGHRLRNRFAEVERTRAMTSLWLLHRDDNVKARCAWVEILTTRERGITQTGTAPRHSDIFRVASALRRETRIPCLCDSPDGIQPPDESLALAGRVRRVWATMHVCR